MRNDVIYKKIFYKTDLILKLGDLTLERVDCIVNAANNQLLAGGGVCGAIARAAGKAPFEECHAILQREGVISLAPGEARLSGPGELANQGVKGIVHAVGPQGTGKEFLEQAYHNCLHIAQEKGFQTISFPSISTGIFSYPLHEAAATATRTILNYCKEHPGIFKEVRFVFIDEETAMAYKEAVTKDY